MSARTPRELTNRENSTRPKNWQRPELLPEPDKEAGYTYRWIRIGTRGNFDQINFSSATREGWEVVKVEEQPKFKLLVDVDSRFVDSIEIGGLVLCKCPINFMEERAEYYAEKTKAQDDSVNTQLMNSRDSRSNMKFINDSRSTVTKGSQFGNGS